MSYIMYGSKLSYYSGKARAYLDWKGLDYEEVRASPEIYGEIILPRIGWPVIPVITGPDDEILQDTSDIIDTLEARHGGLSVFPDGPAQRLAALLFELWGDEWLVMAAMHYRWAYNQEFTYAGFGEMFAPEASTEEQIEIGRERAAMFEGSLPFLGVDARTVPGIEATYTRMLGQLDAHFSKHDMLFGDRPSIGDLGLYGPLYAHLYYDPESRKVMEEHGPKTAQWVRRMRDPRGQGGDFLAGDEVPDTLLPILNDQMSWQFPVLVSTAKALTEWAKDQSSGAEVPRAIGQHEFQIGDAKGERMIFPFNLWMLQRPLDYYRSLTGADKAAADAMLGRLESEQLSNFPNFPRLTRKDFKLVLA